jgi:hypothetical protein
MPSNKKVINSAFRRVAELRAELRSEPDLTLPETPMEIATEMAWLVLEMGHISQSRRLRQRLELLAENFLRVIDQRRVKEGAAQCIENVGGGIAETPVTNIV